MDALPSRELPPGWAVAALGDLIDGIEAGKNVAAIGRPPEDGETGIVKVSAVTWGEFDEDESKALHRGTEIDPADLIRPGDFLISRANTIELVGAPVIVKQFRRRLVLSDKVLRLRVLVGFDRWLELFLKSHFGRTQIEQYATGAQLSMRNISQENLRRISVPVAPEDERARIVAAVCALFEEMEAGKAALTRARECLTQFRATLLHAASTGALSSDGGDGWQTKPLAELISEGPKNGYSPKAGDNENGTLALKLTATTSGRLNLAPHAVKRLSEMIPRGSPLYLRSGDLLFQRGNTPEYVGIAAIYDGPPETYVYPDLMIRVRSPDPALTAWIWRVANAPAGRRHMRNAASGTAGSMPKITGDAVRSLPIPLPPHEEMLRLLGRIEEELNAADEAEALLQAQQAAAVALRQSILHAAFTGRLVPQDPTDEPAASLLARLRAAPAAARRPRARRTATQPDLIETPA